MTDRGEIETLLRSLYAARARGDLAGVVETFTPGAKFEISGASDAHAISVIALGLDEYRAWLAVMIKSFKLTDLTILSILIDGDNAAVHWRAKIHSNITGRTVLTEFVDLVRIAQRRIDSYTEFFVPRDA
jgi:ketosteroid isomerase-like protein